MNLPRNSALAGTNLSSDSNSLSTRRDRPPWPSRVRRPRKGTGADGDSRRIRRSHRASADDGAPACRPRRSCQAARADVDGVLQRRRLERLYSGVTNSSACTGRTRSRNARHEGRGVVAYRDPGCKAAVRRSRRSRGSSEDGASPISAFATRRLNAALRRLPTNTATSFCAHAPCSSLDASVKCLKLGCDSCSRKWPMTVVQQRP